MCSLPLPGYLEKVESEFAKDFKDFAEGFVVANLIVQPVRNGSRGDGRGFLFGGLRAKGGGGERGGSFAGAVAFGIAVFELHCSTRRCVFAIYRGEATRCIG